MLKLIPVGLLLATAITGCSSTGTAKTSQDVLAGSAGTANYTASQVLSSYTQTFATPSFDLTSAQSKGLQGFGVGSNAAKTAPVQGNFRSAVVTKDQSGKNLSVKVDGEVIKLKRFGTETVTLGGVTYSIGGYSTDGTPPAGAVNKSLASTITAQYASLTGLAKNTSDKTITNNGASYALIATGGETPANSMPTQSATYNGGWFLISSAGFEQGEFIAQANFGKSTINWVTEQDGVQTASGTGSISGNQFTGSGIVQVGSYSGSAEMAGAFYGPNAEEIGGVVSGSVAGQQIGGGFLGKKILD